MTMHKLSAGSGYTYLTKQVARSDMTHTGGQVLADYYSEKGESPGRWMGAGLVGLAGPYGVEAGEEVTEEQMKALFGEGLHPNATAITEAATDAGKDGPAALKTAQLGKPFTDVSTTPSAFLVGVTREYNRYASAHGQTRNDPIPDEVRHDIRTRVGRATFADKYGRDPLDGRELAGHIARESRPAKATVAGYDLTFSAPKSVTVLWAAASPQERAAIHSAHHAAITDALDWVQEAGVYTRRGKGGVRQVKTTGLIATAFDHRDNRDGDPHLHTHVAISNKVQDAADGAWLALDGQVIYKINVPASERYNRALEGHLGALGYAFADRSGTGLDGKRAIREVVGVPVELIKEMSCRDAAITAKMGELTGVFEDRNGRPPTTKEAHTLHRIAHEETRKDKAEPRSFAQQLDQWLPRVDAVLADVDGFETRGHERLTAVARAAAQASVGNGPAREEMPLSEVHDLAGAVIKEVSARRATFDAGHVHAQAERAVRGRRLTVAAQNEAVEAIVAAATSDTFSMRLDPHDPVQEPEGLLQAGRSVYHRAYSRQYTTTTVIDAENQLLTAARETGGRTISATDVDVALLEQAANGVELNTGQAQLVRDMLTCGARVQLALAPAGTGKTTAMACLTRAWTSSGGTVVGLAPSAAAAEVLGESIGTTADTLSKLVHHINGGPGIVPDWVGAIGPDSLVVIDEAGMASTDLLATAVQYVTSQGGSVRLIGDDQQLASPAAGGALQVIATDVGALPLSEVVRFTTAGEGAASLAWRAGDTQALGFYLDRGRVTAASPTRLPDLVFDAWSSARGQGQDAIMIAHTNATVDALNGRARADRLARDGGQHGPSVVLRSGLQACAGDVIVTRRNDRTLSLGRAAFVKNGDRFDVMDVRGDGSVLARHRGLDRTVTLAADYVRDQVDLGYASTVHGAQGQSVDAGFALLTGGEDRQLSYVAATRGKHHNELFVPVGGDGDEHELLTPDNVLPPTAVETLERIIRRDGAAVAATTMLRDEHDPARLLEQSTARYEDALEYAATTVIGAELAAQLRADAEQLVPGLTGAPAWDTLAAHLATLSLAGQDPIAALRAAATARDLTGAKDPAAVLDWRLDSTGHHNLPPGPLPWQHGIPAALAEHPTYGPWLTERADLVTHDAADVRARAHATGADSAPDWARRVVDHHDLYAELAVWRAAHNITDTEPSPTGPPRMSLRDRHHQDQLTKTVNKYLGATDRSPGAAFAEQISAAEPRVLTDPAWSRIAERLDVASAAGRDVPAILDQIIGAKTQPLPDDYPAAALWSRFLPHLGTSIAADVHATAGQGRLAPEGSDALVEALGPDLGERVIADPAWPSLVAAVTSAATTTGWTPAQVVTTAAEMIPAGDRPNPHNPAEHYGVALADLTHVLAWRVDDLTRDHPTGSAGALTSTAMHAEPYLDEEDFFDVEADAFAVHLAAENDDPRRVSNGPDDEPFIVTGSAEHVDPERPDPPEPGDDEPDQPGLGSDQTSRERVLELTAAAGRFYADRYPASPAHEYLRGRLGPDLAGSPYLLGYAPPATGRAWATRHLVDHLRSTTGASNTELVDAGLARWSRDQNVYDVFRDRAMIGIRDKDGQLVGFNGRDLSGDDQAPKYLNTPTTAAYTKGNVLFGQWEGREQTRAVAGAGTRPGVVRAEGPLDAIAITLAGKGHMIGVSTGGTACSQAHATELANLARGTTGALYLALDRDDAGAVATTKAYWDMLHRGIPTRSVPIVGAKDPAAMWANPETHDLLTLALAQHEQLPNTAEDLASHIAAIHHVGGPDADVYNKVRATKQIAHVIAAQPVTTWDTLIERASLDFAETSPGDRQFEQEQLWYATLQLGADFTQVGDRPITVTRRDEVRSALNQIGRTLDQTITETAAAHQAGRRRALQALEESAGLRPSTDPDPDVPGRDTPAHHDERGHDQPTPDRRQGPTP